MYFNEFFVKLTAFYEERHEIAIGSSLEGRKKHLSEI